MLEIRNVSKFYKVGEEKIAALDNIDFIVNDGEFVAITGQSGSGKSTLMNILGCLDRASEGQYFIDGRDTSQLGDTDLSKIRGIKIGFVFQNFSLISTLTAYENIELPLIYKGIGKKERKKRILKALESVNMTERMHHLPSQLSGGQMQRVAVARALAGNPSVILADEPTGNLDGQNTREVMTIFKQLNNQGKTVVIVTHDSAVADMAKRRITLSLGKIDSLS